MKKRVRYFLYSKINKKKKILLFYSKIGYINFAPV